MRKLVVALASGILFGVVAPANASPVYAPVGPQVNVPISTVLAGGWSLCYASPYGSSGQSLSSILGGCSGDLLMMAGGPNVGVNDEVPAAEAVNPMLSVLAWAPTADVTFPTGTGNTGHDANGTTWYYDPNFSWGFAEQGGTLFRNSCDYGDGSLGNTPDPLRLCWHTGGGDIQGGWRVGTVNFLNGEPSGYTRYLFTASSVPEPTSMLLLGSGLAAVASRIRRRKQN
jgi:hypothetical protein